jgi:hypothetical protein
VSHDAGLADAGPPSPDAPPIAPLDSSSGLGFEVSGPAVLCGERGASIQLTASGGQPTYHWRLEQAPAGWAIDPEGATAALTTALVQGGGDVSIVVRLTDSAGGSVEHTVNVPVREPPRVTTMTLPSACATIPYGYQFTGVGGDPKSYRWSLLDTNGSDGAFDGDVLTVTPSNEDLQITVQLADDSCNSDPASLSVHVDPNADQCPMIDPPGLPPPCRGYAYPAVQLTEEGGTPDLTWSALTLPDGITFDPTDQTISGTPTVAGASTFDVQVVDSAGRIARGTFPTTVRTHCWFAYVAQSNGAADLYRYDPYLSNSDVVSHTAAGASGVASFAFSPDGNYLVYETSDANNDVSLVLMDAVNWTEHDVTLPGSVLAYAWASDSRTVAVAGKSGNDTWLSGFRVVPPSSSAPGGGTDAGVADPTVQPFANSVAAFASGATFSSELQWVGTNIVLFHGMRDGTNPSTTIPYYARLRDTAGSAAPDGFDSPVEIDLTTFTPDIRLLPRNGGFFAFDAVVSAQLFFFRFGSQIDKYELPPGVADPNGVYSASIGSDALDIYRGAGIVPPSGGPPWASATGCGSILAWASGKDRIVCDAPTGQSTAPVPLRVFDLDSSAATLSGTDIRQASTYSPGASIERRRLVSPSGNWFALTTDKLVYIADIGNTTPHIARSYKALTNVSALNSSSYTQLSFSPNEQILVVQRGNAVGLQRLDDVVVPQFVNLVFPDISAPCSESFTADPARWCGSATDTSAFRWSNDSLVMAGKTANGHIMWWNLSDIADANIPYDDICKTGCTDDYGFQP